MDADDPSAPIIINRVNHYYENGVLYRDYYRWIAVKIYIQSDGTGWKFSLMNTMLQLSSFLALLQLMTSISDFCLWYFLTGQRRDVMRGYKVKDSVDFSDKADRIDYIEFLRDQHKQQAEGN